VKESKEQKKYRKKKKGKERAVCCKLRSLGKQGAKGMQVKKNRERKSSILQVKELRKAKRKRNASR
ncbi:hypothetical protein, partial [Bacillus thuringiensis]|uniref:hypothetical protein n=1 Tax=Bacillus thuringiensis TaxID=1428 RepID=UPI001CA5B37A